mmetsp:Transcript_77017/g.174160  ORF Transcript_77017/g.174160 Transcript_77017/m.174160 type:complete len:203 (+) Transcript_77017:191-799(+)
MVAAAGHPCDAEHTASSMEGPSQGLPPFAPATPGERRRLRLPSPQLAEHAPHSDHAPHWQSIAHVFTPASDTISLGVAPHRPTTPLPIEPSLELQETWRAFSPVFRKARTLSALSSKKWVFRRAILMPCRWYHFRILSTKSCFLRSGARTTKGVRSSSSDHNVFVTLRWSFRWGSLLSTLWSSCHRSFEPGRLASPCEHRPR